MADKPLDDYSPEEIATLFVKDCLVPLDGNLPIPNDIFYKLCQYYCGELGIPTPRKALVINVGRKFYTQLKYKDEVCFRAGIKPGLIKFD